MEVCTGPVHHRNTAVLYPQVFFLQDISEAHCQGNVRMLVLLLPVLLCMLTGERISISKGLNPVPFMRPYSVLNVKQKASLYSFCLDLRGEFHEQIPLPHQLLHLFILIIFWLKHVYLNCPKICSNEISKRNSWIFFFFFGGNQYTEWPISRAVLGLWYS